VAKGVRPSLGHAAFAPIAGSDAPIAFFGTKLWNLPPAIYRVFPLPVVLLGT